MNYKRISYFIVIVTVVFIFSAALYMRTRDVVPEHSIKVVNGKEEKLVDIEKLNYENISGTRVNGKGEEKKVEGLGILIKDLLAEEKVAGYSKVTATSDDAYQAEVFAEEIEEPGKVYLLYEDGTLRLIVFGDDNSKRNVSNVVSMTVE